MLAIHTIPVYKGRYGFAKLTVYFGCLFFCIYYLQELFAKRYRTYFETTDSKNLAETFLSICVSLSLESLESLEKIPASDDGIAEQWTNETLAARQNYIDLLAYYNNRSVSKSPKTILEKANELQMNKAFWLNPPPKEKPRLVWFVIF